jgi:hypothetical protein
VSFVPVSGVLGPTFTDLTDAVSPRLCFPDKEKQRRSQGLANDEREELAVLNVVYPSPRLTGESSVLLLIESSIETRPIRFTRIKMKKNNSVFIFLDGA